MKIVVLDGYTLNPGDLSWDSLEALGEVQIYDRTPPELTVERSRGANVILTNKTVLSAKTIRDLPDLKYIGVLATGYNVVDLPAAHEQNIAVTNIPAYSTPSVAQMVFALLFELCLQVGRHSEAVRSGKWSSSADFSFTLSPLIEITGKTLGIVGYGGIGREVAALADAFGMKVLVTGSGKTAYSPEPNRSFVSLPELLAESDIVTLHCPLTPETKGLINRSALSRMKPTAMLINTSRGPVIVEEDLATALNEERLYGAALDVLSQEPPASDNPLLQARNCVITPHIAWASKEARTRLMDQAVRNLEAFTQGHPIHVVNS